MKVKSNPSYQNICDEYLAHFYVYIYLRGKTFPVSRDAQLKELTSMCMHGISVPQDAYNREFFAVEGSWSTM